MKKHGNLGLSLMELILAMTVLSIVVLGASALGILGARVSNRATGSVTLSRQVSYAYKTLEKDLERAASVTLVSFPGVVGSTAGVYQWTVTPFAAGQPAVTYTINTTSKIFTRQAAGGAVIHMLPAGSVATGGYMNDAGVFVPYLDPNGTAHPVWFDANKKIMTLNIRADARIGDGTIIMLPTVLKSIFIRNATVA